MKYLLIMLFFFQAGRPFCQKKDSIIYTLNLAEFKTTTFDLFHYPLTLADTFKFANKASLEWSHPALLVFQTSSTIYDISEVILVDSTRFFCYYIGCTSRQCSAGHYTKKKDSIILSPQKNIYNALRKYLDPYRRKELVYVTLTDSMFVIDANNQLLLKKTK